MMFRSRQMVSSSDSGLTAMRPIVRPTFASSLSKIAAIVIPCSANHATARSRNATQFVVFSVNAHPFAPMSYPAVTLVPCCFSSARDDVESMRAAAFEGEYPPMFGSATMAAAERKTSSRGCMRSGQGKGAIWANGR